MRSVAVMIGLVVMAGCGPDFDALFRAGAAPDAAPTPPLPERDASPEPSTDAGDGDSKSDAGSDAGCEGVKSCTPVAVCDGTSACAYSCEGCGCVCSSAVCPPALGNSCTTTCGAGTICDVSCNAGVQGVGTGTCTFAARGAKSAAYACGMNPGSCKATCDEGSACALTCNQYNPACHLTCSDTARCLLKCNYSADCKMDCASGIAQTCPDGSKTCNRACP